MRSQIFELLSQIFSRKRIFKKNHFSPDGFDSWKNRGRKSRDTAPLMKVFEDRGVVGAGKNETRTGSVTLVHTGTSAWVQMRGTLALPRAGSSSLEYPVGLQTSSCSTAAGGKSRPEVSVCMYVWVELPLRIAKMAANIWNATSSVSDWDPY